MALMVCSVTSTPPKRIRRPKMWVHPGTNTDASADSPRLGSLANRVFTSLKHLSERVIDVHLDSSTSPFGSESSAISPSGNTGNLLSSFIAALTLFMSTLTPAANVIVSNSKSLFSIAFRSRGCSISRSFSFGEALATTSMCQRLLLDAWLPPTSNKVSTMSLLKSLPLAIPALVRTSKAALACCEFFAAVTKLNSIMGPSAWALNSVRSLISAMHKRPASLLSLNMSSAKRHQPLGPDDQATNL
mmetsp:Transcript_15890/g.29731  ORF Transcript_15890/g.29731 Transcript_15890/m.29731 type:complete len:245 (+) Transcript_15890:1761-2495(+)